MSLVVSGGPACAQDAGVEQPPVEEGAFEGYQRTPIETRHSFLPFRVDAHAALTWEADVGAGLRLDIPFMHRAQHQHSRDELAISLGADMSFVSFDGSQRMIAWPTINGQWTLAVTERFSLYPEVGLVACIQGRDWKGIYPNVGFGGRLKLVSDLAFMGRLGWPIAVSIGLTY
ncbi:MAG TPA: hypothetical protein VFZ61_29005 [Polyangiales bacterium]